MEEGSTALVNTRLGIAGADRSTHFALVNLAQPWHGRAMQQDPRTSITDPSARPPVRGGGVFMALGTLVGTVAGGLMGQPSIGFLAGLGSGIAVHGLLWFRDSRKR